MDKITDESEVISLTVQSDLQKAVASCESAKGTYALMAQSTEDQSAKKMYEVMKADMERHLQYLSSRLSYLNNGNQLNNKQQQ